MIFVTLGTHGQPFTRAVELVADLGGDLDLLIQHGATPPRPDLCKARWIDYLEWDALTASMRDAEVVITHAGVGSAVTALRAGRKPVMLPRLARFGEHVDDHQVQLAQRFAERGLAFFVRRDEDLQSLVSEARVSPQSLPELGSSELSRAVADAARRSSRGS